jgi:hypothetical protein
MQKISTEAPAQNLPPLIVTSYAKYTIRDCCVYKKINAVPDHHLFRFFDGILSFAILTDKYTFLFKKIAAATDFAN